MVYKDMFHIHTHRCGHAGKETDDDYVKKALELGARSIYFTDHAPFPENIFGNRMKTSELDDYIDSLMSLREEYEGRIDIKIGLEIEYLPVYKSYYQWLRGKFGIPLFLGQHICMCNGQYNFDYPNKEEEYKWMTESIMKALDTGLFAGLLHPERIYKNCDGWGEDHVQSAMKIWDYTKKNNIPVEINYASLTNKKICQWHKYFWNMRNHNNLLYGLDAHSTDELQRGAEYFRERESDILLA